MTIDGKKRWNEDVYVSFADIVCKRWVYYGGWLLGFAMVALGLLLDAIGIG
jgi:hypothetical protein